MTKPLRDSMPLTAQAADLFRLWLGADTVDAGIARATKARRRYMQIRQDAGTDQAEDWRRKNWQECTFYAREGGQSIGIADPSPEANAVSPNIDQRITDAAREAGPVAARHVEAFIRGESPARLDPHKSAAVIAGIIARAKVQTSAHEGEQ